MLRLRDIRVTYGRRTVLDGLDLEVADGEVLALLGPSGSGKSTLLRMVAGLERPQAGSVEWDGQDLRGIPPHERRFGLMFQDFALFPHKSVRGNIEFGLRMQGAPASARAARLEETLSLVGLRGFEERSVQTLSGGEQQRVALARALAPRPRLLMLDEPLGSLDRGLRERLAVELRQILADPGYTGLYVTHDQDEAFAVADRVAVLHEGRVEQTGPPQELWRRPASEWVARFLGMTGIVPVDIRDRRARSRWGSFPVDQEDGPARLLLRPESLRLRPHGPSAELPPKNGLTGAVTATRFRGGHWEIEVGLSGGPTLQAEVPVGSDPQGPAFSPGDPVTAIVDPSMVTVLAPGS